METVDLIKGTPKNCFFGVRLQFLNPHLQLVNSGLKILSALKNRVFRSSLKQIKLLPRNQRFYVVEETLKSIRKEETTYQIEMAVEALYDDYLNDKELTAFTDLDLEDFYETK